MKQKPSMSKGYHCVDGKGELRYMRSFEQEAIEGTQRQCLGISFFSIATECHQSRKGRGRSGGNGEVKIWG